MDTILNQQVSETTEVSNEIWDAYKYYLSKLNTVKLEVIKAIKMNKELSGYIIKCIYKKICEDTKVKTGIKLLNLWDYFQTKEFGGYNNYFSPDYNNPIDVKKNQSI